MCLDALSEVLRNAQWRQEILYLILKLLMHVLLLWLWLWLLELGHVDRVLGHLILIIGVTLLQNFNDVF